MTSNQGTDTVRFNVGGCKYEIARSSIELYPNTMLAKLVSKRWQGAPDKDQDIFIDRNGQRFQFVLDYMRDKKVHLPVAVSKVAILQELEYFGFDNVPEGAIDGSCARIEAVKHMAMESKCNAERITKHYYDTLAFDCVKEYTNSGILGRVTLLDLPKKEDPDMNAWDQKWLDKSLAEFGLKSRSFGGASVVGNRWTKACIKLEHLKSE